jgi:hypothetical protein
MDDRILARLDEQSFRLSAGDSRRCWPEDDAAGMYEAVEDVTELGVLADAAKEE